jgi:hypothetical protein
MRGTETLAAGKDFLVPAEPHPAAQNALGCILLALDKLSPDERKRVLHAASAFYRVER